MKLNKMEREKMLLRFVVPGEPKSQPRPRFIKGRVVATADAAVSRWQEGVKWGAGGAARGDSGENALEGVSALRVDCTFWFQTKKSERWGKPHTHKPDRDNLDKLVLDACVKVNALAGDDCRVSSGWIRKRWCRPGHEGLLVEVYEDTETDDGYGISAPSPDAPEWLRA
jgi:Holliday junction resolvase RusA-like endonuclease